MTTTSPSTRGRRTDRLKGKPNPIIPGNRATPAGSPVRRSKSFLRLWVWALGVAAVTACGPGGLDTSVAISVDDVPPAGPGSGAVVVSEEPESWGRDSFVLNAAAIAADTLTLNLSYSGGCRQHEFTLVASEVFLESFPVQLRVSVAHDANGDSCEAWLTRDYEFDLSLLRDRYRQAYGDGPGRIVLLLDGAPGGTLLYAFS